ncbi:MAG TPA: hypothetical protein V6D11_11410 [Waterburya sp.]
MLSAEKFCNEEQRFVEKSRSLPEIEIEREQFSCLNLRSQMRADVGNQLDEQLKDLALVAQQHRQGTKERRIALTQLVNGIWRSRRLCRPYCGQFPSVYADIYDEAVQTLFFYICQDDNIRKYDPERASVMGWVNMLLTRRFFPEAIPKIVGKRNEVYLDNSDLELLASSETISLFEQVRQCIEDDPEGIFRKAHIRGHPEANFRAIAIRRYSGVPWKEISAEWGLEIKSLNTFYQRCLKNFATKFQDYFKDL